jgi:chromate transporter
MAAITLRTLAATYLRIGNTTFGGGDPTILALRKQLVDTTQVLSNDEFSLSYTLARATPGTNVLAFCAGTGWQMRGWIGAMLAVSTVCVPSSILAVLVAGAFQSWMANPFGYAAISATLAAAVGLMFAGAWLLIRPHTRWEKLPRTLVFVTGSFVLAWRAGLSPLQIIGLASIAGLFWRESESR